MFIKRLKNIKRFTLSESKGDTIVEVLISIAIMSLVLSISYALSNRNTAFVRQSQEKSEAQKLSERQLELLRNYLTPEQAWNTATQRCFNAAGQPSNSECDNINGLYSVTITPSSNDTYTVTTTWASLTGNAPQNLQLSYKLPVVQFDPVQFNPTPDSYINIAVKKIPPLPSNTADPNVSINSPISPPCSNSATQTVAAASTNLTYNGPGGGSRSLLTGADGIAQYENLTEYGSYTGSVTAPTGYQVCTGSGNTTFLPGNNPTIDLSVRPICPGATEVIGQNPVYVTGGYWSPNYGWIWTGGYWQYDGNWDTGYWPAGYGSVNPPYNTVFEAPGNRLELYSINWNGHDNRYHYWYYHYHWVNTYAWGVVSYSWITYTYISHYEPIYGTVYRCQP